MRTFLRSFAGGQVTAEFFGRGDEVKFQTGLAFCLNFITLPHGPARNRPGSQFCAATRDSGSGTARKLPFTFSTTQTHTIEFGATATPGSGYFRFFTNGVPIMAADGPTPLAFSFVKQVTNVQITPTNTLDTTTNHLWTTGEEVMFGMVQSSTIPAGFSQFVAYFVIAVDANTVRLATTLANALAGVGVTINSAGAGTFFLCRVYRKATLVTASGNAYYCHTDSFLGQVPTSIGVLTCALAANVVTAVNHGTVRGAAIVFRLNGGTLPAGIVPGTVYYAIPLTANTFSVAATFGSLTPIVFGASTGSPTFELFEHWHLQQGGIYEIPHPYLQSELFFVNHWQSNDVVTLTHRAHRPRTLRRFGITNWQLVDEPFGPVLPAPTGLVIDEMVTGAVVVLTAAPASGAVLTITSNAFLPFQNGETVHGSIDMTGTDLPEGFYRVSNVAGPSCELVNINGTVPVTTGTFVSGGFRAASLSSEISNSYVVVARDDVGNKSLPSSEERSSFNILAVPGSYNVISWEPVAGASRYLVYKWLNGLFGLIGDREHLSIYSSTTVTFDDINDSVNTPTPNGLELGAPVIFSVINTTTGFVINTIYYVTRIFGPQNFHLATTPANAAAGVIVVMAGGNGTGVMRAIPSFRDENIPPDLGDSPPRFDPALGVAPFPAAGCYHEQRKVFARDQNIWMTRPGTERDLTFTIPVQPDDRVAFAIAATEFSQIQHMVSMGDLIALTSSTEYAILSPDSEIITPTSIMPRPQSFIGASHVKPVLVNNSLVYAAARGGHLRELGFKAASQGFATGDLSLRATDLFDNQTIVELAFSKAPYPIVWAVISNGKLLGLTLIPDQEVAGWHQHTLGGADAFVESCCVVAEGNEDRLSLIVRRTVNGVTVRYYERLSVMALITAAESVFVDSARTFTSVSAGQLSGYIHLRGKTVAILADGIVLPQQVVNSSGEITLLQNYARVTAGLPIDAQIQTLPLFMQLDGFGQGQQKSVYEVFVRVVNSAPFFVGPSLALAVPSESAAPSIRGLLVPEVLTPQRRIPVTAKGDWTPDGQVFIQHRTPLPLTVVGLTLNVAIG